MKERNNFADVATADEGKRFFFSSPRSERTLLLLLLLTLSAGGESDVRTWAFSLLVREKRERDERGRSIRERLAVAHATSRIDRCVCVQSRMQQLKASFSLLFSRFFFFFFICRLWYRRNRFATLVPCRRRRQSRSYDECK